MDVLLFAPTTSNDAMAVFDMRTGWRLALTIGLSPRRRSSLPPVPTKLNEGMLRLGCS